MLNKAALKTGIFNALKGNIPNPSAAQLSEADTLAGAFADVIDTFVKGVQVNYTTGLIAPSGGGPVTGVITHTIS